MVEAGSEAVVRVSAARAAARGEDKVGGGGDGGGGEGGLRGGGLGVGGEGGGDDVTSLRHWGKL